MNIAVMEKELEEAKIKGLGTYVKALLKIHKKHPAFVMDKLATEDAYTRLRFALKRQDMSTLDLANKTALLPPAISRAFAERRGLNKHWKQIAEALNESVLWLEKGIQEEVGSAESILNLGSVNKAQDVQFLSQPSYASINVDAVVALDADFPHLRLKKGDTLLLARRDFEPGSMAVIKMKDGTGLFGQITRFDEPRGDVYGCLTDGAGYSVPIVDDDIVDQFIVVGMLFNPQSELPAILRDRANV